MRCHVIMAPLAADADQLLGSFRCSTLEEATKRGTLVTDIGQFVFKNLTMVIACSAQARDHVASLPWIQEMLDPSHSETFVGVGTNGADFSTLAQNDTSNCFVSTGEDEVDHIVNHTQFYTSLRLFEDIRCVRIVYQSADTEGVPKEVIITIDSLWRKAWVAQLSACKCLQWLIAQTTHMIHKPRKVKEGMWDFIPALQAMRAELFP